MKKLRTSITPRIFIALLIVAYISLGYMAYILFFPFPTISVYNEPFPITNGPVQAGRLVIYHVDYCRYTDVDAQSISTLVGNVSISLGHTDSHLPKGCFQKDIANVVIPSYTPPGTYYIQIDSTYQLSRFRSTQEHFRTADFMVTSSRQSTSYVNTSKLSSYPTINDNNGLGSVMVPVLETVRAVRDTIDP